MSIKFLCTADWHLGSFRSPMKDGVNLRTEDTKHCLDEMLRVAREEKPDYALISGDVFHVGRLWSDRCCEEIITAFHYIKELAAVSKQVVVMRGTPNHDGAGQFNVLAEMFADVANVNIVITPQVISFEEADIAVLPGFDRGVYRSKFPGLSKEEENEVFTSELANIVLGLKAQCNPDKKSVLMAHYTVPGCNTESGQTMLLTQFEPVLPVEALRAADYDLVALGHIHRPQKLWNQNWYYSGAINTMNFNDEGQDRGFWIHNCNPDGTWESIFHKTPAREFITFNFTDTDITAINLGHIDEVAMNYWRWNGAVQGKIVRIHYSCSADNQKAYKMKESLLEKTLLDDGAFMLWENLPDKIDEFANRTELAHTTDPEANLIKYLEEKQIPQDKIQELVLKARPVISEAEANMPAASNTGIFEPIEISVKNYRNYEEETFNFEDISFCTINGQNGAGKSSLFMDAIIDCLFEEPREGVIKDDTGKAPWLRNSENVRSGSIIFTFRIGEKKYRVTRTRAKSGKGTLNISQFVEGEWMDCSKERYNDTQQEILNIIGMDSFTFKSCALIMQDQYGLFLQAKPEERVEVLGTLLGLGVYQIMEKIASDKAKVNGAKSRELNQEITIHNATISELGNPDEELKLRRTELEELENKLQEKASERDQKKLIYSNQQAAVERQRRALEAVTALQNKKIAAEKNRATQQAIADSCSVILSEKTEIEEKAAKRNSMLQRELELAGQSALFTSKKQEAENFARQVKSEQEAIQQYRLKIEQKEKELELLQPTELDAVIRQKAEEYTSKKEKLDQMQEKAIEYQKAKSEWSAAVYHYDETVRMFDSEQQAADEKSKVLTKKVEILNESGCMDINNAKCKFLQDAIEAKEQLDMLGALYSDISARRKCQLAKAQQDIDEKKNNMDSIGFDVEALQSLQMECAELLPYVSKLESINQRENRIALINTDLEHLQSNIAEAEKRLSDVKLKGIQAETERDVYAKAFDEHANVVAAIADLEPWAEKEKQLPVAEERNRNALTRVLELTAELVSIEDDIAERQAEADREEVAINGIEEMIIVVNGLAIEMDAINEMIRQKQMRIGALLQDVNQITKLKKEISALHEKQVEYARETSDYDTLKVAFSRSGIPHQIIRSIIPQLTSTANSILGQMTGGKMGVEFRLERMQKNGKEKVTLDIFIDEYGKTALPYLSKSGGEKVKSSLSVILALAEIKSSSAGIHLGMLFIDEPPFLDNDGIQAYCDALDTIQNRYPDIKIMAITHDPTMKARFPQSLDVIKTEQGSKVIY